MLPLLIDGVRLHGGSSRYVCQSKTKTGKAQVGLTCVMSMPRAGSATMTGAV